MEVAVNAQPKHLFFAKLDNRATDFYLVGWAMGLLDSYDVFRTHYLTHGGENASGYSNLRVDELVETIGKTTVTYARDAMIEEVWKIVLDDIVYIPSHYPVTVWAMRDNLDLPVYPFNLPLFREARFKYGRNKASKAPESRRAAGLVEGLGTGSAAAAERLRGVLDPTFFGFARIAANSFASRIVAPHRAMELCLAGAAGKLPARARAHEGQAGHGARARRGSFAGIADDRPVSGAQGRAPGLPAVLPLR